MKSLPDDIEMGKMPPQNVFAQAVSFDRFLETVIAELSKSADLQGHRYSLPSVITALKIAYVSAAKRSPSVFALPITRLVAAEVVSRGWIQTTVSELNDWATNGRFYRIESYGDLSGEYLFPVWQFVGPTPNLIGQILPILARRSSAKIHTFWVCASDELNELAPAELLAGIPFETREHLDPSQSRYLQLPASDRLQKVIDLARV